jgi:hypothetical protein
VEYLARCAGLDGLTLADYPRRTRVRHHIEVRAYLEIEPWGAARRPRTGKHFKRQRSPKRAGGDLQRSWTQRSSSGVGRKSCARRFGVMALGNSGYASRGESAMDVRSVQKIESWRR